MDGTVIISIVTAIFVIAGFFFVLLHLPQRSEEEIKLQESESDDFLG